jgi:hypothetical protein
LRAASSRRLCGVVFKPAIWQPEVVDVLLPVCDKVIPGAKGQPGQMADWDKLQAIAGELMNEDETLYPPLSR